MSVQMFAVAEWSEESKCYIARCEQYPCLVARGKTRGEALDNITKLVNETIEELSEFERKVKEVVG